MTALRSPSMKHGDYRRDEEAGRYFEPCGACARAYDHEFSHIVTRLQAENPDWTRTRLFARARVEQLKRNVG